MKAFDWKELALLAQQKSPYYKELYQGLQSFTALSELPIVDQANFWKANTVRNNRVLTAGMTDGIVFKSGGTTGNPKFSIYTRQEWHLLAQVLGAGMSKLCLAKGDRIANLFYAGELYSSFIAVMKSIEAAPFEVLQFPIGGGTKPETVMKTVWDFEINVLAGMPTTILRIAEYYNQHASEYPDIRVNKIMFAGESMYSDQRKRIEEIFPGVQIVSAGYASVDGGLLGYADASCGADEHRVYGQHIILEIVDEDTLEPIYDENRPGKLLVTNLMRSLLPVIRYPVGERAVWAEPASADNPDRKFLIRGRSEEAARVSAVSVYYEDVRAFLASLDLPVQITGFQLVIRHYDNKDALTLRFATPHRHLASREIDSKIADNFAVQRQEFAQHLLIDKIHPLSIEWVDPDELEINSRSGKLRRVIDQRL